MEQEELQKEINKLKLELEELKKEVFNNNFIGHRDFNKKVSFTTRLKVPHYDTLPTVGEVGEVIELGGALYICSTSNSFTLV